jgi:hypothetical protein
MTHPQYSQPTLEALSTTELKTIASKIGAIPDGDKRVKQTWVTAIIDHQTKFSPAKVAAMKAHIETVTNRLEPDSTDETVIELPTTPIETPTEDMPTTPIEVPIETIDSYVPTPRTHADDVAFATAMGLTYEDVFGLPSEAEQESIAANADTVRNREASIVALVAVLVVGMAFLVVKMGLTSIAWVIAALSPLALGLWRYLLPDSKKAESIDYFPSAIA